MEQFFKKRLHFLKNQEIYEIWVMPIIICIIGMTLTYFLFVDDPLPRKIIIASGDKAGTYHVIANRYKEYLEKSGIEVEVLPTTGSMDNIKLLSSPESGVSLAFVQSGTLSTKMNDDFAILASIFREPIWVFYRGDNIRYLHELAGKKVTIGSNGSRTQALSRKLFIDNGLDSDNTEFSDTGGQEAATLLTTGKTDASFFVASPKTGYIQDLLSNNSIGLMSFDRHEGYARRYKFLSPITIPEGLFSLSLNIPDREIRLLSTTVMLVTNREFHPALIYLVLEAAKNIHQGNLLDLPNEFPSDKYTDLPVHEDAKSFLEEGKSFFHRFLPFKIAHVMDRLIIMLVPLLTLLIPILKFAPPIYRWRIRSKIYRWYSVLHELDLSIEEGISDDLKSDIRERISRLESDLSKINVPMAYMEEFYSLRLHINLIKSAVK